MRTKDYLYLAISQEYMVKLYSHSKLWLFENCPEAYKIRYIDKAFPDLPKSVELFLGDIVHQSLEWFYGKIQKNNFPDADDLITKFAELWHDNFSITLRSKEKPEHYFNKGIKFLVDYYYKNKPFVENTIHIEEKITFPLDENKEYLIQGYIDRIVLNESGEYEVHDYKTNDYLKTQEQIDADRQLALYHLGLQEIFGKDIKVKLIWHFLAHNKTILSTRTPEQLQKLKEDTLNLIKSIESNSLWLPCNKPWCDWCSFKKNNALSIS